MQTFSGVVSTISKRAKEITTVARTVAPSSLLTGFTWATVLIASITLPLILTSLFFPRLAGEYSSLANAAQSGLILAILASGSKIHWVDSLAKSNWDFTGSVKLTLITLLLQLIAFRLGRRVARSQGQPLWLTVALTATGFASTIYIVTNLISEFQGIATGPKAFDWIRVFLTIGLPMALGALFRSHSERHSISESKKHLKSARTYALLLSVSAIVAGVAFLLVQTIRPDFVYSQATVHGKSPDNFYLYLFGIALAVILNFPTLAIGAISVLSGASLGVAFYSTYQFPGFVTEIINKACDLSNAVCNATTNSISGNANLLMQVSEFSAQKRSAFIVIFILSIALLMAISSSVSAGDDENVEALSVRVWRNLLTFSLLASYLLWLVNGQFTMSEQAASSLERNLGHGHGSIGLATGSIYGLAIAFAFIAALATGKKSRHGFRVAFPFTARAFGAPAPENANVKGIWKFLGIATRTAIAATLVISIAGAIYERTYAIKHGPSFFASKVQSALENGDVQGFIELTQTPEERVNLAESQNVNKTELYDACPPKPFYCLKHRKAKNAQQDVKILTKGVWLKKEILSAALPKSSAPATLKITNSHKKPHQTGQLDATITYLIDSGSGKVEYPLALDGSTRSLFHVKINKNMDADYLTAAKYKYQAQPVKISLSKGEFFPKSLMKKFTINGKLAQLGTFNAVPGTYRIKLPGYKLILPTDITLHTDGLKESVQVGGEARVPEKLSALMDKRYKKFESSACKMKFTNKQIKTNCWSDMDIWWARKLISGKQLKSFDTFKITKASASRLRCVKEDTELTSASSVLTHYICTSTITQTVRESVAAKYEQGDPIYRNMPIYQTETYDSCPNNPWFTCDATREVIVGYEPRVVGYKRGALISPAQTASAIFRSTMKKDLYIRGSMLNSGKFSVQVD